MPNEPQMHIHFSDHFGVDPQTLENHGAFNISLVNDLPLFVDPFLVFNSSKQIHRQLHDRMIEYLRFLRDRALSGEIDSGLVDAWYRFPERKENWLGFSKVGNQGRGLGRGFAESLYHNLNTVFSSFGEERITRGSHIEKLTLIEGGVGRDKISDFTTNLIVDYLLDYTERFAADHIASNLLNEFAVEKVTFDYKTETWRSKRFNLPSFQGDFVLLTPKELLTKEEIWINSSDMVDQYDTIVRSLPNDQLRAQLNNYLANVLPKDPTRSEKHQAIVDTIKRHPGFIEYYIRSKEEKGELAVSVSSDRVIWSEQLYIEQARNLAHVLIEQTEFYEIEGNTLEEARRRVHFLKDVIENKGGWRVFYVDGVPVRREHDLHILYRLTWYATPSDVSREVNDGRGQADFKISRGSLDKSIVEFKLASNTHLRKNLEKQVDVYRAASDADHGMKVILSLTDGDHKRARAILNDLALTNDPNVVLIDGRSTNKPSGSKA